MDENMTVENPYNNEVAFNDVLKMMKRKDIITVSFLIDEYGYECASIDSKRLSEKFNLQLNPDLLVWLVDYLNFGKIYEPLPVATKDLSKSEYNKSEEFTLEFLKDLLIRDIDLHRLKIVPEIVDRPGRLTITYNYPFGILVFKVERTDDMLVILANKGF